MPDYDLGTARGKIELDASSLGRASAAFATLGKGMLGFSAVAVGGFIYVAKAAADFEKILSAVKAVSGATAEQMDVLREKALTLGSQSIFSADQIAEAFENLAKAGITTEEIIGGAADAVVHLAHAAGTELPGGIEQGAEIIANAMKTFEVGADQAEHFADVLVGAAASSTLTVDDMATSFRYAGPIAHELGLNIDDLSAVLAILGDRGIKGSTAGTTLRGVLIGLNGASGPATEALKGLGIITEDGANKFYDLHGNMKPISEVMQILQDATAGLTQQQKIQAFQTIFQRRAMNGALILADQGAAGFDRYAASIAGLNAADIAATKLDNLSGDMTILKNSIHSFLIRAGEPLQEMLRGWVQHLTGVVEWLSNLDPHMLTFIVKAVGIVGAITGILGVGALLISMGIKMYVLWKNLAMAIGLLTRAFGLLSMTLLTSPWFWVIAALVLLGIAFYQLYQRSESFRAFIDGLVDTLSNFFLPILETVKLGVEGFLSALSGEGVTSDGFVGFMERIGVAAKKVGDFFNGSFMDGIEAFWNALRGEGVTSDGFIGVMERIGVLAREVAGWLADITDGFSRFWTVLTTGFTQDEGGTWFEDLAFHIRDVGKWLQWLVTEGIERVVSGFEWFNDNILPVITTFAELVAAVVGRVVEILGTFTPVLNFLLALFRQVFDNIMTVVMFFVRAVERTWSLFGDNIIEGVMLAFSLVKQTIESALRFIQGIIQIVTGLITGDWGKVWEGIQNVFGAVWDYIAFIPEYVLGLIKLAIETGLDVIHSIFSTAWDAFTTLIGAAWDNIYNLVVSGITLVIDTIKGLPGQLAAFTGHMFDGLVDAASSAVDAVWGFFSDLPGRIMEALVKVGEAALSLGQEIIDKLGEGLSKVAGFAGDIASAVGNALKTAINGIIGLLNDAIPNSLGWGFASIDLPDNPIPTLHSGGEFRTRQGREGLAWLKDREHVFTPAQLATLKSAMASVTSLLGEVMAVKGQTQVPAMVAVGSNGGGSTAIKLEMVFPNVGSAKDAQEIRTAVNDPSMLSGLRRAIATGVGRN